VEGVHLLDLGGRLCPASGCERVSEGVQIRPDGVHYTMEGGAALARWLLERLQEPAPP
jgi:lysophospholipase L1-like esterase